MAWTEELPSGNYRAAYRAADGKKRYVPGTFAHEIDAKNAAGSAEHAGRKINWRNPDAAAETWGDWATEWWDTRDVENSTLRHEKSMMIHIRKRWGETPLALIKRQDVRAWANRLSKEGQLKPSSVQRILNVFRSSMSAAIDADIIDVNPVQRVRVTVGQEDRRRYLTLPEAEGLFKQFPDPLNLAMVSTLIGTGLRWGEMAGLQVKRYNGATIRVAEVWEASTHTLKAYPKGKRIRDVPVPPWVRERLDPLVEGRTEGFIFSRPEEMVPHYSNWLRKKWHPAVKKAKADDKPIGVVKIHDLRHTYASWLIQAGVSLAEVGRLLGHTDPSTTQIYAHLAESPVSHIFDALPPVGMGQVVGQIDVESDG